MKKKILPILIAVLMIVFVCVPLPKAGITLRFYFEELEGENMLLYYTTSENPNMGIDQTINAMIDKENNLVEFKIPAEIANQLGLLRLDFPDADQIVTIRNISVSSAGTIKHQYNPCDVFAEQNIAFENGIEQLSLVPLEASVYIHTGENDPYIVFGGELAADMQQYRSQYRLTRLLACLLVCLGYGFYRKSFFSK